MMRLLRYALLASLTVAAPAFAADLAPQAAESIAPIVVPYSWTGFYAGINGGYAFSTDRDAKMTESDTEESPLIAKYGSLSPKGGFGGIQAGYNLQYGNFVFGLEADIQGAGISDKTTATDIQNGYTVTTKDKVNWFGTIRPRVGYAFDNLLVYATGGLAVGGVKYGQDYYDDDEAEIYAAHSRDGSTKVGFVLGAGVEYAISEHWSAKLEYQYINLGSSKASAPEFENGLPTDEYAIHGKMRTDFHTIRLGLNYKF